MNCFITCNKTASEIGALDIKELLNKESEVHEGVCLVKDLSAEDFATLAYRAQSAHRVCIHLFDFKISKGFGEDELRQATKDTLKKTNLDIFEDAKTFGVDTNNQTTQSVFDSTEMSRIIGGALNDSFEEKGFDIKVNLSKPQLPVFAYIIDNHCFVGIDLIGFDLMKRPYKLITQSSSLNGVFGYTIARLAGVKKDSVVLDPFCGSGTIPIELALFQQEHSCFHFEHKFAGLQIDFTKKAFNALENKIKKNKISKENKITGFDNTLKVITSAKKNSKIAGILDAVNFSKVDIEWIDSKFDEGEVEIIITNPPKENNKNQHTDDVKKLYDELFYQGRFVLSDEGTLAVLTNRTETLLELAKRHGYTHKKTIDLLSGEQPYILMMFSPPPRLKE